MIWVQIAWFIVTLIASIALAPKPPKPRSAAIEDFDFPTAEEGRPVPVVFGTMRVAGPNVLWYGDLGTKAIKKSSMFSSQTVGYMYFVGLHFGVCHGPIDALTKVEIGEKEAWTGSQTVNGSITIDKPKLFGGKKKEGGIQGTLECWFGGSTQLASTYLDAHTTGTVPAYRGITGFVFKNTIAGAIVYGKSGGYIGTTSYPKPWAFHVRRIAKGWQNDVVWYSAKAAIGTSMNPAHILYQSLTDPEWGMGLPETSLDSTGTWEDAADQFFTEGFGLDLIWNQATSVEEFIQTVLDHVGGLLRFNHHTGKLEIRLIRDDYDAGSLATFDESNIRAIKRYQRQAWGETVNEVTLLYTDAATRKNTGITVQDLGNIRSQTVRVAETVDYPGITSATVAQKVAQRELASRSTPLATVEFDVDRSFWSYTPGDVVKLSWDSLGIASVVFRVIKVRGGTLKDGEITVEAVEDIFGLPSSSYAAVPSPGADPDDAVDDPDVSDVGGSVISTTTTAPPGSPTEGDRYFVPTGATGAWAGHDGEIAIWDSEDAAWVFEIPGAGTVVYDNGTSQHVDVGAGTGATAPPPWVPSIPPLSVAVVDAAADYIAFYDTSAGGYRKTLASLGGGGGGGTSGMGGVTGAHVSFSGTLNLTSADVYYFPSFGTEVQDDQSYFESATPTRFTAPRDGWYIVSGTANGNAGDTFSARIYKNGVETGLWSRLTMGTSVNAYVNVSGPIYLLEGDYVELGVASRGGGDTCNLAWFTIVSLLGTYTPAIADAILATTPLGYWRLDTTSGSTFPDISGNGYDLTITSTITLADTPLVPTEPDRRYAHFGSDGGSGGYASRTGTLGLTTPVSDDLSFFCVINTGNAAKGSAAPFFSIMASGETEATNYQIMLSISAAELWQYLHEYSAGTDVLLTAGHGPRTGTTYALAVVRDAVAKTVTYYVNGFRAYTGTYATAPSGGGSCDTYLGGNVQYNSAEAMIGEAAVWNRKLSVSEIVTLSRAAGFFGGGTGTGGAGGVGGYPEELGFAGI